MLRYLDKRLYDNRLYDIDCTELLDDDEQIMSAVVTADDQPTNQLMFGPAIINAQPIIYPMLARTAPIGKVVQVRISGGALNGAADLLCMLRIRMVTSVNPALEATVMLRLLDSPT